MQNCLQWKSRLISVVRIESHIRKCLPYTCCKNENYGICLPDLQGKKTVNLWVFIYIFKSRSKFLFWYFICHLLLSGLLFSLLRPTVAIINFFLLKGSHFDILFAIIYCLIIYFKYIWYRMICNFVSWFLSEPQKCFKVGNRYLRSYDWLKYFQTVE